MMRLLNKVLGWLRRDEGQTLVEYALIVGLVSIAAIVVMIAMGGSIGDAFGKITSVLSGVKIPT
jgi:pilus assembly protein Flp/PilA